MLLRVADSTNVLGVRHRPIVFSHILNNAVGRPVQQVAAEHEDDDRENHYNEKEEVLEILGVASTVRYNLFYLAEVALESFPALARAVQAHASVHALTRAVLDFAAQDLNVRAVELFVSFCTSLILPYQLENARVAGDIGRELNFLRLNDCFFASAWEVPFVHSSLGSRAITRPQDIILLVVGTVRQF